jgi:hypothetical protein
MKEYLDNENFNWSCRTHRVSFDLIWLIYHFRVNMVEKCGGAAVKGQRMHQGVNSQSMRARMMRMRIKTRRKEIRVKKNS